MPFTCKAGCVFLISHEYGLLELNLVRASGSMWDDGHIRRGHGGYSKIQQFRSSCEWALVSDGPSVCERLLGGAHALVKRT